MLLEATKGGLGRNLEAMRKLGGGNTLMAYVGLLSGGDVLGSTVATFHDHNDGRFCAKRVRIKVRKSGMPDAIEYLGAGVLLTTGNFEYVHAGDVTTINDAMILFAGGGPARSVVGDN